MLNFKDTLTLTKSKMKARKGRTIGTAITMSLGLIVLMSASFAAKGVENTALDLLEAPTNDRWFGSVNIAYEEPEQAFGAVYEAPDPITLEQGERILSEMKARENVLDGFMRTSLLMGSVFGLTTELPDTPQEDVYTTYNASSPGIPFAQYDVSTIDPQFLQFYVRDEQPITERRDNRIPVIIPSDAALALTGYKSPVNPAEGRSEENAKEKNERIQSVIGTVVRLQERAFETESKEADNIPQANSLEAPEGELVTTTHDIELVVVGVTPGNNFLGGSFDFGTLDILVAPEFHKEIAETLGYEQHATSLIAEYASEEAIQKDFTGEKKPSLFMITFNEIELSQDTVTVFPIVDTKTVFTEILSFIRRAGYFVGGFLLLISAILVWTSLGRIVRDSRREIGVFRAVGARKRDIVKIVVMYALIVATLAFLISAVLSVIITLGASSAWGDQLFYTIASLGGIADVNPPAFAFFGISPLIVLGSIAATLLASLIGAFFPARKAAKLDPVVALRDV